MTNEKRIYKLCEYVMDLIDELTYNDESLEKRFEWIKDEIKTIRKDIDSTVAEQTEQTEEYGAEWKYWAGWCGNHDKRIEDATCSKCGYEHPTIRYGSPDLLQDYCPSCKSKMKKK
jgi:hypothetical protein